MRAILFTLLDEIQTLDQRIAEAERQIAVYRQADVDAQRLNQIPGIGLLTSTAIVAAVGDLRQFRSGRQFAAWLGVTPKEHSSGQRRYHGGITKRGNIYLRKLFIHGARSVLVQARTKEKRGKALTPLETWGLQTQNRTGFNKATVALANKLARRAFALARDNTDYDAHYTLGAEAA